MIFFSGLTREHKQVFISLIVVGFLSTGCGGGSSSADNSKKTVPPSDTTKTVVSGTYTVKIVDDNIIGTTVSAPECATFTDNGSGSYTLKECISIPSSITAVGGYIDINGNGSQDTDEPSQDAPLKLKVSQSGLNNGFVVTPLSTLATQETDLTTLATKLGVSKTDLFKDNAENRNLQRSINALLIAARAAGITKYDSFIKDFKNRILESSGSGLTALTNAKDYMSKHKDEYTPTYGIVFGGFISDTTDIDLTDGADALTKAKGKSVLPGKIRLGGFIYDGIIANADITIYDGATPLARTTSDANGKYSLEIDAKLLETSKVLKIVAISGKTKLIAYITTDELKAGLIGQKLSNAQVEDLIVSNVTTAKAVLVEKIAPAALIDAQKMVEAKTRVEQLYPTELVTVAAAIKDVVDNNTTITQTDTTLLAKDIVTIDPTTQAVTTTVPEGITITGTVITEDPLLNGQLNSTKVPTQDSVKVRLPLNKRVDSLLSPTASASVSDAKNMFNQLRETVMTSVDLNNIDTNTSTILGSQIETLNTKMKPAVQTIATNFGNSTTALQTSVDAFSTSVQNDMNSTINAIRNRIDALVNKTKIYSFDQNWSVFTGDDNLSRTITISPTEYTEVYTLNGNALTIVSDKNNQDFISATGTGSATFTGSGYNLAVSQFSLDGTKVKFVASGEIDGDNGAKMTLRNLNIVTDANLSGNNPDVKNTAVTLDGTLTAGGRTLVGSLTLNETANSVLAGKYTGLTTEPSFDGNITVKTSLNSLFSDIVANRDISNISHQLVMVNNSDGSQDLVTGYAFFPVSYPGGNTKEQSIILSTQTEHIINCSLTQIQHGLDINNTISCIDTNTSTSVTLTPYLTKNGKVTATVDGVDKIIGETHTEYNSNLSSLSSVTYHQTVNVFTTSIDFLNDNQGNANVNTTTGKLELNGNPINITKLVITPELNIFDRTFDFYASGLVTDGAKQIKASFGVNRGIESKVFAKDIEITDGESVVKLSNLSVVLTNAEFLKGIKQLQNASQNHYSSSSSSSYYNYNYNDELKKSIFEDYNINYDEYYSNEDLQVNKLLETKLDKLQVSLYDTDNELLTLDSNLSLSHRGDSVVSVFDGMYEYRGTKFVGHIDFDGRLHVSTGEENTLSGNANVSGTVEANGFTPFDIEATTTVSKNNIDAYGIFKRSTYQIGLHFVTTTDAQNLTTGILNIGDTKNILGTLTFQDQLDAQTLNSGLIVKDKDANNLATYGEKLNSNTWEIKYSDGTSETLF